MGATLLNMGKKKKEPDRHKPRRLIGVPERICLVLEEMGRDRMASVTEMVKVALLHFLESHGKWPPNASAAKS